MGSHIVPVDPTLPLENLSAEILKSINVFNRQLPRRSLLESIQIVARCLYAFNRACFFFPWSSRKNTSIKLVNEKND